MYSDPIFFQHEQLLWVKTISRFFACTGNSPDSQVFFNIFSAQLRKKAADSDRTAARGTLLQSVSSWIILNRKTQWMTQLCKSDSFREERQCTEREVCGCETKHKHVCSNPNSREPPLGICRSWGCWNRMRPRDLQSANSSALELIFSMPLFRLTKNASSAILPTIPTISDPHTFLNCSKHYAKTWPFSRLAASSIYEQASPWIAINCIENILKI